MGFISQAKQGVVWTFLQQFSVQIINFVVQIFLARLLLPSDFGLIAMITIFIAIGQSLSDSGMTSSLIRGKNNTENDYGTVFITNFVISILIYLIVFFLAPFVAQFYDQPILASILRVYALIFIISSFYVVQIAKFTKELNFKSQFTYQLPSVIIGALTGLWMAYKGFGVWSLVGLNIAQAISFTIILLLFYNWRPKLIFDRTIFRHHFDYGYKLTISSLLTNIYLNFYKILIGKIYSPVSVGYFTQADNLRQFPVNQLTSVLNKVTFPLFATIQDDNIKLKQAYRKITNLVLSITSLVMFTLILIAKPLYLIIYGEKWLDAVPYFQILCIASIFLPINIYNLNILKVKGQTGLYLKVDIIKKIIGFTTLLCVMKFGIMVIVWSLCITNIFFAFLNGYFSGKLINYTVVEQIYDSFKVILLGLIPTIILYFFSVTFELNEYIQILLISTSYTSIYIVLIYLFNKKLLEDIKLILKR